MWSNLNDEFPTGRTKGSYRDTHKVSIILDHYFFMGCFVVIVQFLGATLEFSFPSVCLLALQILIQPTEFYTVNSSKHSRVVGLVPPYIRKSVLCLQAFPITFSFFWILIWFMTCKWVKCWVWLMDKISRLWEYGWVAINESERRWWLLNISEIGLGDSLPVQVCYQLWW